MLEKGQRSIETRIQYGDTDTPPRKALTMDLGHSQLSILQPGETIQRVAAAFGQSRGALFDGSRPAPKDGNDLADEGQVLKLLYLRVTLDENANGVEPAGKMAEGKPCAAELLKVSFIDGQIELASSSRSPQAEAPEGGGANLVSDAGRAIGEENPIRSGLMGVDNTAEGQPKQQTANQSWNSFPPRGSSTAVKWRRTGASYTSRIPWIFRRC